MIREDDAFSSQTEDHQQKTSWARRCKNMR